jgi:GMP synthase (glutamine-hydrolysing)
MSEIQKGERQVTTIKENPLCSGTVTVYQSHSFEISKIGKPLAHLGRSKECNYEIVQYRGYKIFGTQFHPEMTSDGLAMIERFVSL